MSNPKFIKKPPENLKTPILSIPKQHEDYRDARKGPQLREPAIVWFGFGISLLTKNQSGGSQFLFQSFRQGVLVQNISVREVLCRPSQEILNIVVTWPYHNLISYIIVIKNWKNAEDPLLAACGHLISAASSFLLVSSRMAFQRPWRMFALSYLWDAQRSSRKVTMNHARKWAT